MKDQNVKPTGGVGNTGIMGLDSTIDKDNRTTLKTQCLAVSPKAVLAKFDDKQSWIAKSNINTITGVLEKGAEVTIDLPNWAYQAALKKARPIPVNFNDPVLVSGYCVSENDKSIGVECDADGGKRHFPKSKIIEVRTSVVLDEPITLVVPAWTLKHSKSDTFPTWVKSMVLGGKHES